MRVAWKEISSLITLLGILGSGVVQAQSTAVTRLGLQECIDIALKNNITVRQGQLNVDNANLQLRQSRLNLYPTANFQGSQSYSAGLVINPIDNTASNQVINSSNYQLNSSVTLFNGFAQRNAIRQNSLALDAGQQELRATRNNVALNVVQQYLNVLTGREQLQIAQRQAEVTQAQLDRTQRQVTAGSLPEANLYDIRAQLANNELDIVNAQNTLDLAKVALLQAMNVPVTQEFDVEPIDVADPTVAPYAASVQEIYETAAGTLPEVQGADLRIQAAGLGVEVARGSLYPIL